MIVERDARREHVDERKAVVAHSGLDQRHELRLVAGEAARNEGGAERQREQHRIDGRSQVHIAPLRLRTDIRGG